MYIDDGYKCKECGKVYHANKYYLPKYCKKCGSQLVYKKGEWYEREVHVIATPIRLRLTMFGWIEFDPNVKHPILSKLFKNKENDVDSDDLQDVNYEADCEDDVKMFKQTGCVIIDKDIYIDGKIVEPLPKQFNSIKLIQNNEKVYLNGYEYLNGVWKRTLKSLLIYLIG